MSLQLEMLSGLPASGKTTYANEKIQKDGSYGRVNRDELRQTILGGRWTNYNEKIIIEAEEEIVRTLLKYGRNVVVDDTNLAQKHEDLWKDIASQMGAEFHKTEFNTSVEECIRRDLNRKSKGLPSVGRNVIVKMALRNGFVSWPDKDIVLVDIDGTLMQSTGREKYLRKEPKDWKKYYSLLGTDVPIKHIFRWVKALSEDYTIVIVSGRGAEYEDETRAHFEKVWEPQPLFPELETPRFPVFQWLFRDKGDRRDDSIVKEEFLKLFPRKPSLVLDDRPSVVSMWRKNGIFVIPVDGECESF